MSPLHKKLCACVIKTSFACVLVVLISWRSARMEEPWMWIQRCLLQAFNQSADTSLKKWSLSVTPGGFFRLRKYFPTGKQEYFSFHFKRLKDVRYEGTFSGGEIVFNTIEDDIIVQTFGDPNGDIDSMSTLFKLPVLDIPAGRLDSLRNALMAFKY